MKLILAALMLTLFSCASHQDTEVPVIKKTSEAKEEQTTIAYGGHCAMGMCKKVKVKGDEKYAVDYKGKRYLFSKAEYRDEFVSDIENNIKRADTQWKATGGERIR